MRVFVTGATGFVGLPATRLLLARGHEVLALVRDPGAAQAALPGAAFLAGDLPCDPADAEPLRGPLSSFAPEALLHLAWQGLPDYSEAVSSRNVELGLAAMELALAAGARRIVASGSCWEYASRRGMLAEDAPLKYDQPFPAAKNRLHALGAELAARRGARLAWLRLFFVYGPGQRPASLIPTLISQARAGQAPSLRSPANRNDFIHVDDVALAFALALERELPAEGGGGAYNVGSGLPVGVADVARMVYAALGREELLAGLEAQAAACAPTEDFWADTARMAAATGFAPRVDLAGGIAGMARFASARPEDGRT